MHVFFYFTCILPDERMLYSRSRSAAMPLYAISGSLADSTVIQATTFNITNKILIYYYYRVYV